MESPDKFIPLADLSWPVTVLWDISTPFGLAHLELTVDIPALTDKPLETEFVCTQLFSDAIAPAISFQCTLVAGANYVWKLGRAVDRDPRFPGGTQPALAAPKGHGVAVVMHTGHTDRRARRRLILPGCPRGWIDNTGQVTEHGAGKLLTHLRGMFGGLNGSVENAPMAWLLAYPDAITDPLTGTKHPGFRRVEWLRLCSYTVPVPDP